jgi:hypothetical protein
MSFPLDELLDIDWDKQAEVQEGDYGAALDLIREVAPELLKIVED